MYHAPLLIPLFAQVVLTFAVWLAMYQARVNEMKRRRIEPQAVATRAEARSVLRDSAPIADNFANQFETPVLFYAVVLLALVLLIDDPTLAALAWVWVVARVVHAVIHCTYNAVMHRFMAYLAGCIVLWAMWFRLAWILWFA